ncbi:MAG: hypothetical protein AB1641_06800 [Thermodesulfobacteriota bacterium]
MEITEIENTQGYGSIQLGPTPRPNPSAAGVTGVQVNEPGFESNQESSFQLIGGNPADFKNQRRPDYGESGDKKNLSSTGPGQDAPVGGSHV